MDKTDFSEILTQVCGLDVRLPVLAGVSGGADSLCLLHLLGECGFRVIAAHFDHRLRPASSADAEVVRSAAAAMGAPFVLGSGEVKAFARATGASLEAAARALRYRFLFEQARPTGAQAVAVGHTADDQVETALMHLIRGSGLGGLAGMAYRSPAHEWDERIPLVRPLLGAWRADTEGYCREHGIAFAIDETNQSTDFFRNRVRLELIPLLQAYNPQVKQSIWRLADLAAGDLSLLDQAVQAAWERVSIDQGAGYVCLAGASTRALPHAMLRLVVRRAAQSLRPALRDIGYADVERAVNWIRSPSRSGQVDWVQGLCWRVERGLQGQERLLLFDAGREVSVGDFPQLPADAPLRLPLPGSLDLGAGWSLTAQVVAPPSEEDFSTASVWEGWLDAASLPEPLFLRPPRPGDRFQPLGMVGHSLKLSDFFTNRKIPRRARARWPLVCSGELIAWVPGLRPAHALRITPQTGQAIYLRMAK